MKKLLLCMLMILIIFTPSFGYIGEMDIGILDNAIIVSTSNYDYEEYLVKITKDGISYTYRIQDGTENLPLQLGSGIYEIKLFYGNNRRFKLLNIKTIEIELNEERMFLTSHTIINWNDESKNVILARELTKEAKTDKEKFDIIYNYVVNNITYDYKKANSALRNYIPKADQILEEKKGICFDFAVLMGTMLRAVDVPTKLVKGTMIYISVYHAWNEVLIDGEWIIVDTSTDSIFKKYGVPTLTKTNKIYNSVRVY